MQFSAVMSIIGVFSIGFALFVLGELSRQFGRMTGAGAAYILFYFSSFLIGCAVLTRILLLLGIIGELQNGTFRIILYNGLPVAGVTISVFAAWRYWSWLLAERG